MYCGRDFSPMEQMESETFGLSFINDFTAGEVISSIVGGQWTISVSAGTDTNATAHLIGGATIVTPDGATSAIATIQRISGLLPEVTYAVGATVITSLGNTKNLFSHILGDLVE